MYKSTWEIEQEYSWEWLGDVNIEEGILNEQGYFYKDE